MLLIPLGFTLARLSIFGNTAISPVLEGGQAIRAGGAKRSADGGVQAVRILALYPADRRLCGGDKLRAVPDAGRFRHADDSEPLLRGGSAHDDAPARLRVFWAAVTTLVCAGLLYAGSFSAMQTAVVLCGLPFSAVIVLYMVSLRKDLCRYAMKPVLP